ncbi:MAG: organomercurial lyase [Chloroflexota bacterium]
MTDTLLWQARHFIYAHLVDTTLPPSVDETARQFDIRAEEAGALYKELADRHAIFLEPETLTVRMAWPFSGVPTDFKVHVDGKTYFANCAWDMLGIPAALHRDAVMEAVCTESNEKVTLEVKDGQISNYQLLVHFPLPFVRWYDDLVFT